jgi:hypothetical protein
MKTLELNSMEELMGGSSFSLFCKGFGAAQVGWGIGMMFFAATPPGMAAGVTILAIDAACLFS